MNRTIRLSLVVLLLLTVTTGCWNLREPDQLAFILAAGLDLNEEGKLEITSQIAVPAAISSGQSPGGSGKKSFVVVSGTGKNVMDAGTNLQTQLPRSLFYAHRQSILIGERLARKGLGSLTDMFIRNPKSEMRSSILVVKDGLAKDVLAIEPLFDPYISTMLVREQVAVGLKPYYYRQFLADALCQATQPILPAVSVLPTKRYIYSGAAILNKDDNLKLVGYLNPKESFLASWIIGRQNSLTVTAPVGAGGDEITLNAKSLSKELQFVMQDPPSMYVMLKGAGFIVENNTKLNPAKDRDLNKIEHALSLSTQEAVQALVEKVQKQYKADVLGFGEYIHREHPYQWKELRSDWTTLFPRLRVTVKVELKVKDPGQTNSSIDSML
ncbi:Ger(x)C family spore germination protein [Paenibacillus silvisoli]|uniref:Ger(x)C family spore germination protein n=1 Tax=Paenibacillus silvisoli TaxID=3110539 RepID=UPI0028045846|nr:Ger(x)C family spore germination protein [Paenibacillus silvisoli]